MKVKTLKALINGMNTDTVGEVRLKHRIIALIDLFDKDNEIEVENELNPKLWINTIDTNAFSQPVYNHSLDLNRTNKT